MKFNQNSVGKWLGAMVLAGATTAAMALPVLNPGFESGDADWSVSGTGAGIEESTGANTIGTKAFRYFGSDSGVGRVSQSLTFQAGHDYFLSFFLRRSTDTLAAGEPDLPGTTPTLSVTLGLTPLTLLTPDWEEPDAAGEFWWQYGAEFATPNGGSFDLAFEFNGRGDVFLDQINVTDDGCSNGSTQPDCGTGGNGGNNDVPEPGSLLLVGAALAGLGLVRRRKAV